MKSLSSLQGVRILITGGAGMIGSTIARQAIGLGAEVVILDAMLPMYGGNVFNFHGIQDRVEFIQGDIRDCDLMKKIVARADYIFSLAAQVSSVDSNDDPLADYDMSCRGQINLLNACKEVNRNVKIVFASSRLVYGRIDYNPVDEKHPFNCLTIYGIHKLTVEKYYQYYNDAHGIKAAILRIANPYGPRQQMKHNKYGIVNWFIRLALENKPLTVFGDGSQLRDYIYVEDLAEAFLHTAASSGAAGQVFNVGSGIGTSVLDMANIIAGFIPNTEIQQLSGPTDRYVFETGDYISDIRKLTTTTGWQPVTSLPAGIAQTIDYYRKNRNRYW